MIVKINCIHNDEGAWCENKHVKRSLWGFGARCCSEYENKPCSHKIPYKKGNIPHMIGQCVVIKRK